jgi:acyl dehydratase
MSIQVDRSVVGKEYPPFAVTVERSRIKDFARAIGDLNPFYFDESVGRASPWADIIAPPTFGIAFRGDGGVETSTLLQDLGVDISRVLHGE